MKVVRAKDRLIIYSDFGIFVIHDEGRIDIYKFTGDTIHIGGKKLDVYKADGWVMVTKEVKI